MNRLCNLLTKIMRKKTKAPIEEKLLTVTVPLGIPTQNGRIYNEEGMQAAVKDYLDAHKGKVMLGELNPNLEHDSLYIKYLNVSHQITKMEVQDSSFVCHIELLDTPAGKVVQDILKETGSLRFEPRTVGEWIDIVHDDGTVTREWKPTALISFDIV